MRADQIERAAYIAAHAILATNLTAPELACPGARRSYTVDAIADVIRGVFEVDHTQLEPRRSTPESVHQVSLGPIRARKVLQVPGDPAVRLATAAGMHRGAE